MKRRVVLFSSKGLLLVEAVLSAIVIAVGLTMVSRGLGGQLKALRAMEDHKTILSLASGKFRELEAERLAGPPPAHERPEGFFRAPYDAYHWRVSASFRDDLREQNGDLMASDITMTVEREDHPSSSIRLRAIWPSAWVPSEWY